MLKPRNFCHVLKALLTGLLLAAPMVASATMINLSGTIDRETGPAPTVSAGDAVTGSFNVNLDASNSFGLDDLNFFNLAVGGYEFNLASSDFRKLSGSLSYDGTNVDALEFLTDFINVTNGRHFILSYRANKDLFKITAPKGGGEARLTFDVSNVAVPEPSAATVLSFALIFLGLGFVARRRRNG